jgi:hypothetical protein
MGRRAMVMKIFLGAALLACLGAGDEVRVENLDRLKTIIKPRVEETKWEEIPWQVDLWQARRKAAETGKPILLWEMDGNPMGCG